MSRAGVRSCVRSLGVTLALCATLPAWGSSVREVDLGEMLERCALVFEGEVMDSAVRPHPDGRRIHTYVGFAVRDVVKGSWSRRRIVLRFLGGEVDGRRLVVGDLDVPEIGDRGIYFVEFLDRDQVHPLFGWDQGTLRLRRDARGVDRLLTHRGRPIRGVELPAAGGVERKLQRGMMRPSTGVARGLRAEDSGEIDSAIEARRFKQLVRAWLAEPPP